MPFFKTNSGINLHYEIYPRSAPVQLTFIHGHLGSTRWWTPLLEIIKASTYFQSAELTESIVLIDFHGCGKSESPRNIPNFTFQTVVNDIHDLIASLNEKTINLVGHSAGGLICLHLLAKNSNLFRQGFLISPVGLNGLKFQDNLYPIFDRMLIDRELTAKIIGSTIYKNDSHSIFFKSVIAEDAFIGIQKLHYIFVNLLRNYQSHSIVPQIKSRIEVLHGEHDLTLPIEDSIELNQQILGSKLIRLTDCGHCPIIEKPLLIANLLMTFIQGSSK